MKSSGKKGSAKSDRKSGAVKDASSDIKLKVAEEAKIRENPFEKKLIEANFDFVKWEKYFPRETIISHKETFDSFDIDEGGTIRPGSVSFFSSSHRQ